MTSRNSRGLIASALLATGSLCWPAQAQVSPQEYASAPADHLLITRTGIDLRSGQYQYRQTDLAIGGEGIGGLQLTRLSPPTGQAAMIEPYMIEPYAEAFGNFTHNLDIMIMETRVSIFTNNYHHGSGSDFRMFVRYGMPIETFDGRGSTPVYELVSKQATARLTYTGTASSDSVIYTFQNAEGTLVTFRSLGSRDCASAYRCAYVSDVVYPDGTKLSFEYSSTPGVANTARLRSVTSSRGYAMLLEYGTGSYSKRVAKACVINLTQTVKPANNVCPVGAPASTYTYATLAVFGPMLASSTDQGGGTWGYQYQTDAGGLLTSTGYVKPGQQTPWMTLDGGGQHFADGTSVGIDKQDGGSETEGQIHDGGGTAIYSDGGRVEALYAYPRYPASLSPGYNPDVPNNFCGEVTHEMCVEPVYQITPGPVSVTDQLGRTTTYEYCDPVIYASFPEYETDRCVVTPLRSYTDPEGIKTEIVYDAWRNVSGIHRKAKPGSNLPDLDLTAYYDCVNRPKSCAKPSSVTDGRGNTTNWTYDPNHGGVLTETGPAVNGISPQKRYGYTQRYAWISNGAGGYAQAATPVWLLTSESSCRTSAWTGSACTAGASDEVVTSYDYGPNSGPNNLWLRGTAVTADGVTRRTCFAYDGLGRKISETTPNANLASCP